MGYYIKYLPKKKSMPQWKVQFISYTKSDTKKSRAIKPKKEWAIPKNRWPALGFNPFMTLDEAKIRSRQLNAQLQLKRQEEQTRKIADAQAVTLKRYEATLPSAFVTEFESRFVRKRDSQTEQGLRAVSRASVIWRAAQRLIVSIGVEPSEWFYQTDQIYDYFFARKMSLRYLQSVLKFTNLWGFFICRKLARPFMPVSPPRGYERQRIIDAYLEKRGGVNRASKPIAPEDLEHVKEQLNQNNHNWLSLSVWFGLRPKEVDSLKTPEMWKIATEPNGLQILWVYQTKIIALPYQDRWKPIPILFPEQRNALSIIASQQFRRPLIKTMRKNFGEGVTLYAGRKGFVDLMLSKKQAFENISVWMGHSTLQRTWESYKNRRRFHLNDF